MLSYDGDSGRIRLPMAIVADREPGGDAFVRSGLEDLREMYTFFFSNPPIEY